MAAHDLAFLTSSSPLDELFDVAKTGLGLFVDFKVAKSEADVRKAQLQFEAARLNQIESQRRGDPASPWGVGFTSGEAVASLLPLLLIGGAVALVVVALR